jgi:hypothetical protein
MSFIVEDGNGVTDANSYATEQQYRDYYADRGIDVTSETQAEIEGRLVRAADYCDESNIWQGEKTYDFTINTLQFPRQYLDCFESDEVPFPIIEYAIVIARDLVGKESVEGSSGNISSKRIGPVTINYSPPKDGNSAVKQANKKLRGYKLVAGGFCRK